MGDEIARRHFNAEDFTRFRRHLDQETALVGNLFAHDGFSHRGDIAGFELEAWLVDKQGQPAADNEAFLENLGNPLVVPELAAFNIELNGSPCAMTGRVFARLHDELAATWDACRQAARSQDLQLAIIGILPTISPGLLNSGSMSNMVRYQALNDRVLALRNGAPVLVDIEGSDTLRLSHDDVMLEAATTSFQIHLQCQPELAARTYNAALAASAPMVALAANSPFLFGKSLWQETRIPLFEQAVSVGPRTPARVSFGSGYADDSLFEIFKENLAEHPILLPAPTGEPAHKLSHIRLHNGTIWRWNRPLLGFDFDGQPHLRIEHRVVPAGPTIADCIGNAAVFLGLVRALVDAETPIESELDFAAARYNFYAAAQQGLDARLRWRHGMRGARELLLEELLPAASAALAKLDIPDDDIDRFLGTVTKRVEANTNGAAWQRRWVEKYGADFGALTNAYVQAQESGKPVHEWSL